MASGVSVEEEENARFWMPGAPGGGVVVVGCVRAINGAAARSEGVVEAARVLAAAAIVKLRREVAMRHRVQHQEASRRVVATVVRMVKKTRTAK